MKLETKRVLRCSLFYTALPFVERLIFMATPYSELPTQSHIHFSAEKFTSYVWSARLFPKVLRSPVCRHS